MQLYTQHYQSPLGILKITATATAVIAITFCEITTPDSTNHNHVTALACLELQQYFEQGLQYFTVPLQASGTPFQQQVWLSLLTIPYGSTTTYKQQANKLGNPLVIRAMANANGKNPIAIMIPCHRVIGSNGGLTGYAGGLSRKAGLLQHEATVVGKNNLLFI